MQYEGVVDIFQSIRILRTQRPGMVQTEVIFICYIIIIYIIKLYIYVLYNCIHVKNGSVYSRMLFDSSIKNTKDMWRI